MDPLALSTAFATIVGLLCNFKSERNSKSDDEYSEFVEWLQSKNHDQLLKANSLNKQLGISIKSLLSQNHETVISKLFAIDGSLILLASKVNGLKEISKSISPNIELSSQAISVLKQLEASGGSFFIETDNWDGLAYDIMDASGTIEVEEQRFIKDDLEQLISLNLLTLDFNNEGNRLYRITRSCVRLLKEMEI